MLETSIQPASTLPVSASLLAGKPLSMRLDVMQSPTRLVGGAGVDDRSFGMTLGGALRNADSPQDTRHAAEEFVSIAFIQPILQSLRESNNAAPPFAPTPAEKSFGPMLDAELARRIVAREQYGLVESVARQLLRQGQPVTPDTAEIDTHA